MNVHVGVDAPGVGPGSWKTDIAKVVDVGSGAGFPGLVIALARPDLRITLIEKRRKRAHFLWHIRRELGAENVDIKAKRAEYLSERAFDAATGRAAAKPREFVDLISPKVKILFPSFLFKVRIWQPPR